MADEVQSNVNVADALYPETSVRAKKLNLNSMIPMC